MCTQCQLEEKRLELERKKLELNDNIWMTLLVFIMPYGLLLAVIMFR